MRGRSLGLIGVLVEDIGEHIYFQSSLLTCTGNTITVMRYVERWNTLWFLILPDNTIESDAWNKHVQLNAHFVLLNKKKYSPVSEHIDQKLWMITWISIAHSNAVVNFTSLSDLLLLHWRHVWCRKIPNLHANKRKKNQGKAFQKLLNKTALN